MTTPGWEHLTQAERNLRATLIGAIPASHPVWEQLEVVVDAAIAAAVAKAEAAMKERCAKVAEGELSATDRVVQSEIAHRIRALE